MSLCDIDVRHYQYQVSIFQSQPHPYTKPTSFKHTNTKERKQFKKMRASINSIPCWLQMNAKDSYL